MKANPDPEAGTRRIIFGGAFDPVHWGHIRMAEEVRRKWPAEGVVFVPTYVPPHRSQALVADFDDRVAMVTAALSDEDWAEVSTIERELPQPNYSLETVRALKRQHPDTTFAFLIGADQLPRFRFWHKPLELLAEVPLLVGSRPGTDTAADSELPTDRVIIIPTTPVDISATSVRQQIRQGITEEALGRLVPPRVAEYILKRKLYR
ncbi:MAG: nicotinate (nicotinamide) nucleotide adenylyltransferase [Candidatus Zixiibacteriota bacterium]|nr:MAG: nicotinate (nicotinamide) nucleotide adenylyltransferase [candidate division Zixibacteria bacterium]